MTVDGRARAELSTAAGEAGVLSTVNPMLNPIRSEQEAFRFLIYVLVVVGAIVAVVLILRAVL